MGWHLYPLSSRAAAGAGAADGLVCLDLETAIVH